MAKPRCRICFQLVPFKANPCPRCGEANPIDFENSYRGMLLAIAAMIIAVCVVR